MPKLIISETDFGEFIQCPLRYNLIPQREAPILEAGKWTAKWLLQLAYEDELPALAKVREVYEKHWTAMYKEEDSSFALDQRAWRRGLKALPRYARRLHDLAVNHLVLHPTTVYTLPFGRNTVKGEYAVLTKPRKKAEPLILRLRFEVDQHTEVSKRGPDPVNMLRWLHFRNWEATLPMVRVLNYAIDTEESWTDFFNERVVRRYLNHAASNLADGRLYPSPGTHCETCRIPVCNMEAQENFRG